MKNVIEQNGKQGTMDVHNLFSNRQLHFQNNKTQSRPFLQKLSNNIWNQFLCKLILNNFRHFKFQTVTVFFKCQSGISENIKYQVVFFVRNSTTVLWWGEKCRLEDVIKFNNKNSQMSVILWKMLHFSSNYLTIKTVLNISEGRLLIEMSECITRFYEKNIHFRYKIRATWATCARASTFSSICYFIQNTPTPYTFIIETRPLPMKVQFLFCLLNNFCQFL